MRTPTKAARAVRKVIALIAVISVVAPLTVARATSSCGSVSGYWTTIAGPRFPAGSPTIADLAVDPRTPSRFFVTNGTSVIRTTDGGCSWDPVYELGKTTVPGQTFTAATARIRSVVVPESGGRVLLAVEEQALNQVRPHVVVSLDAGRTWQAGDTGLPPLGSPEGLVVAHSSPDVAYLGVDLGGGTIDTLFASGDGGRTWQPRGRQVGNGITDLAVDPITPNELWAWGTSGLHHSTDGGQTFTPVDEFVGTVTGPVGVYHRAGKPSSLMAFIPSLRSLMRSEDGGENWLENFGLTEPTSIARGSIPESVIATSAGRAYAWAPALFSWVRLDSPQTGLTDAQATRAGTPRFFFRNTRNIVVFEGPTGANVEVKNPDYVIGGLGAFQDLPEGIPGEKPELKPGDREVKIPAGRKKRVTYSLSLEKARTPVDIYFLIDTSESMKPFLRGLAQGLADLVRGLNERQIFPRFGLAQYRAYPDSTPPRPECGGPDVPIIEDPQCEHNFVYKQEVDFPEFARSPQLLAGAIEDLQPIGGGHYNAPLPALYQTATGAGEDVWPYGVDNAGDVPQGEDASFGEKALRLIVHGGDEDFNIVPYANDNNPPRAPSFEQVIGALNKKQIYQVGLAMTSVAAQDMRTIAKGTDSVAPSEGVDCNGDGSPEIAGGQPLVCQLGLGSADEGVNLVPAIVNLVEGIRNRQDVTLTAESEDDGVVASITPDLYPGLVLEADQDLKFDVTYSCPLAMAGERATIDLAAHQGEEVIARGETTVICGRVAKDRPDNPLLFFPFERVIGFLLVPPVTPPVLTNPGNATQAQSQAQAQGAMAAQEQEQPQVAFATQYKAALKEALAREEDYAMTSYRGRTSGHLPPGPFLAAAAAMMAATYAFAASRRRKVSVARTRR